MDLIAITSCGYFTKDASAGSAVYYCIDLPDVIVSKNVSPDVKISKNLNPKLSIKEQD